MKKIIYIPIIFFTIFLSNFAYSQKAADEQFRREFPRADSGNPDAMFIIGKIYLEGQSSAGRDTTRGLDYMNRAASRGNVPAIKFMADKYENGNLVPKNELRALELYLQLQKGGDRTEDEKISRLLSKVSPRPLTANFCRMVEGVSKIPAAYPKTELAMCALGNLSSAMTQSEAIGTLKDDARTNKAAFITLLPYLLDKNTPDWDPNFIETNLTRAGLTYKDSEVQQAFKKNDISFDGCRKLDPLKRANLTQRPAVCRLAARSGDSDAALYVGDAYLNGKDYFEKNQRLAKEFLQEAMKSSNQQIVMEVFPLLLDQMQSEGNIREHFSTIKNEIQRKTPRASIAAQKFDYEADYLLKRYSEVDLDLINDIVDLASSPSISKQNKAKVAQAIGLVIQAKGRLLKPIERDSLRKYRDELIADSGGVVTPDNQIENRTSPSLPMELQKEPSKGKSPTRPAETGNLQKPSTSGESYIPVEASSRSPTAANMSMQQFNEFVKSCRSNQANSCLMAGKILIAEEPPKEIFDLSMTIRATRALEYLETAINFNNFEAMELAVDLYRDQNFLMRDINSYSNKDRANELVKLMIDNNYPGGIMRIAYEDLFNPENLFEITKKKAACRNAAGLVAKTNISESTKKIVTQIHSSAYCSLLRVAN